MNWKDAHLVAMYTTTILVNPNIVVELGTGFGLATEMFSDVLEILGSGVVYTVDKYPDNPQVVKAKERFSNRNNIIFITGDSVEIGKNWNKKVDILYVDSDHRYEHVLNELRVWGPKSKIIFIHDIFKFNPSNPDEHGKTHEPYYAMVDYCNEVGRKYYIIGRYPQIKPEESVGMIK